MNPNDSAVDSQGRCRIPDNTCRGARPWDADHATPVSGHDATALASRIEQARQLRDALIAMTIRYGASEQNMAYAERRYRDGEPGAKERYLLRQRAAHRQFAAVLRLANALRNLAVTR